MLGINFCQLCQPLGFAPARFDCRPQFAGRSIGQRRKARECLGAPPEAPVCQSLPYVCVRASGALLAVQFFGATSEFRRLPLSREARDGRRRCTHQRDDMGKLARNAIRQRGEPEQPSKVMPLRQRLLPRDLRDAD
jgi:hypothetical protein